MKSLNFIGFRVQGLRVCGSFTRSFMGSLARAPKKHISKNKDRDIPYKPPYNEAQQGRDVPIKCLCLCPCLGP